MSPTKYSSTQFGIADIPDSDNTLQTAASTAENSTPAGSLEAEIHDDDDLDDHLGDHGDEDTPMDNDIGHLHSHNSDENRLDVGTQHRVKLDMLLGNQDQRKVEQRHERGKMAAEQERTPAGQY